MPNVNFGDETLDSLDIDERINELQYSEDHNGVADRHLSRELKDWVAFKARVGARAWQHGITFMSDAAFEDHAIAVVFEALGVQLNLRVEKSMMQTFPFNELDWDSAIEHVRQEYNSVLLDGIPYYYYKE